jgi:hypothetical protein
MTWLIVWIVLSVPFALLFSAFISFGEKGRKDPDCAYDSDPEIHNQTFVG